MLMMKEWRKIMIATATKRAIKIAMTMKATKKVKMIMSPLLLHILPNSTKGRERLGLKK